MDIEEQYVQSMEKFGNNCISREDVEVGSAFLKFAVFTKELTALFKNLVRVRGHDAAQLQGFLLSSHLSPVCSSRT